MKNHTLDTIIPVSLDLNWPTEEEVVQSILELNSLYGFTRFMLASPSAAWRTVGLPPKAFFEERAELFLRIKNRLLPHHIECGWWITATLKSGPTPGVMRQVKANGELHPFSNCPLDSHYRELFCESIALFARIAKPAFIVTEDDFSIAAAGGCFCEEHLKAFAAVQGRYYSRDELVTLLSGGTPEAISAIRSWREVLKQSLVSFAQAMRSAIDQDSPEIPMGFMQPGGIDFEGAGTLEMARALAGPRHVPFSRLYGTFYGGFLPKLLPERLYHPLFSRQHIEEPFLYYHESDTFPHSRHFTSGSQMNAMMGAVYSFGFDGSTFQVQSILDAPNEETAYGSMFAKERARFQTVHQIASKCALSGITISYDPFWNTVDESKSQTAPLWTQSIGRFGIPFTTLPSNINFWDDRQAKYSSHEEIMSTLSHGLFLDGDAAASLCERGYGHYLGVMVGDDVLAGNNLVYDLGAREIIRDSFCKPDKGRYMHSAHMLSVAGNGKLRKITVTDPACEVISEFFTGQKQYVAPAMTRFENQLGGKIVVMGLTLDHNQSQALYNYRRQRLIQELVVWCGGDYAIAKDAPDIFMIMNIPKVPEEASFKGMLTLINLCEDPLRELRIQLPQSWSSLSEISCINQEGIPERCEFTVQSTDVIIRKELHYLTPLYLIFS